MDAKIALSASLSGAISQETYRTQSDNVAGVEMLRQQNLGGRPAASLARRHMLPVSRDTLLRVVRRRAAPTGAGPVTVIEIDDFAFKRGQRYGTLACDLEQRGIVDLLPDCEPATVEAWLEAHPEITVVSRDRGGGYGQAATKAEPQAVQVAVR